MKERDNEMENNNANPVQPVNQPAPAPAPGPASSPAQVSAPAPSPAPAPAQYQQYQQPYQQGQAQPVIPQYPDNRSDYDLLTVDQKAERRKKANILCFISLGLHFAPELILGIMAGIMQSVSGTLSNGSSSSEIFSTISSMVLGSTYIASWVFMIIARVKYKESKFAKVLMWIYIGMVALYVIGIIILIAMCAYILKDCQGF